MNLPEVWDLAPGEGSALNRLVQDGQPDLQSAFDVDEVTMTSVSVAAVAIAELGHHRGLPTSEVRVSGDDARAGFANHLLVNDERPPIWSDLSGYYRCQDDRFVQFHCNFPHHAAGVVALLGGDPDRASVEASAATWDSENLEAALIERDMIAAKLRTLQEWDAHPHAIATRDLPLLTFEKIGEADPRPLPPLTKGPGGTSQAMSGIRIVDCSRVLAGPVVGHMMAAHGADVLRLSSPQLPAVEICVQMTGAGKRNAFVDLDTAEGKSTMGTLLADAHVWVDAYRPGGLEGKGFSAESAAELNPGIVVVQLSAFDWVGPWAGRRGFDSIVQSTTGIVDAGSKAAGREAPTPLPVQALDYATGQLGAFAAARALQHQSVHGGSWRVRLSLLRTRNWLVGLGGPTPFKPAPAVAAPQSVYEVDSAWGRLNLAKPPTGSFTSPPMKLGTADAVWLN